MDFVSLLCFCLFFGSSRQYLLTAGDALEDPLERGHASLNEMFRELEMLMGDTQFILAEAVDQMASESAKSSLNDLDKLGTLLNDTLRSWDGNNTDRIGKDSNGITKDTSLQMNGRWNDLDYVLQEKKKDQQDILNRLAEAFFVSKEVLSFFFNKECMVDEDCGALSYCLYDVDTSRCLPCRAVDMTCNKDEECCSGSMCVWGQCTINATRGAAGSICQYQSDCRPLHCCAFQRELLFPVCTPRPSRGEPCLSHPNLLMDLLAWDQDGPRDHCPCVSGLHCQQHGRGSLCEK